MITEYQSWKIVRRIGNGKYGTVYEIEREDMGQVYKSALKLITIPPQDNDEMKNEAESSGNADEYYYQIANEIANEINIMYKLHGHTNIVNYEDHEVRKHADGKGYDILIRMELLTPLDKYMKEHTLSRRDVIQLGIDICQALERCRKFHIMHRDIKPANILVSEFKEFKLGDFGIARVAEKHSSFEYSQKGTYNYMSPEVFHHKPYGFDVDMYSLGIVMYRLLNNNRLPFLPPYPEKVTHADRETALRRRMRGEAIPLPSEDHTRLAEIILKACSYNPEHRYSSPTAMKEDLMAILYSENEQKDILYDKDVLRYRDNSSDISKSDIEFNSDSIKRMKEVSEELPEGETVFLGADDQKCGKERNLVIWFGVPILLFILLFGAVFVSKKLNGDNRETTESETTMSSSGDEPVIETLDDSGDIKKKTVTEKGDAGYTLVKTYENDKLVLEQQYHPDKTPGFTFEYTYDMNGNMMSEVQHHADGTVWKITEYEYEENFLTYKREYVDDELFQYTIYEWDENEKQKSYTVYDASGSILELHSFEYSDDGTYKETILSDEAHPLDIVSLSESNNEIIIKMIDYFDVSGICRQREEYGIDGTLICYCKITYDYKFRETQQSYYLSDHTPVAHTEYEYSEDGNTTLEKMFDHTGTLIYKIKNESSPEGNLTITFYDNNDTIVTQQVFDEEGNELNTDQYNSYGQ